MLEIAIYYVFIGFSCNFRVFWADLFGIFGTIFLGFRISLTVWCTSPVSNCTVMDTIPLTIMYEYCTKYKVYSVLETRTSNTAILATMFSVFYCQMQELNTFCLPHISHQICFLLIRSRGSMFITYKYILPDLKAYPINRLILSCKPKVLSSSFKIV